MAASFGAAAAGAFMEVSDRSSANLPPCRRHCCFHGAHSNEVSFRLFSEPKLRLSSMSLRTGGNYSAVVRAQLEDVQPETSFEGIFSKLHSFVEKLLLAVGVSAKTADSNVKPEGIPRIAKIVESNELPPSALGSEESIFGFISHVANLAKHVLI